MDGTYMPIRSLGALGSVDRLVERMESAGADGIEIVDAEGATHRIDKANLAQAKLLRSSEGWLWLCPQETREVVFQEGIEGLLPIGATQLEGVPGHQRKFVLDIEDRAETCTLATLASLLVQMSGTDIPTLVVHGSGIERLLETFIAQARFETLEINGSGLELDLELLVGFRRHLCWLTLRDCQIEPGRFSPIRLFQRLQSLQMDDITLAEDDLSHLTHLPKLDCLWMFDVSFGTTALGHVGRCTGLTDLWIRSLDMESGALRSLSGLPHLRELTLDCPAIGDAEVPFLLGLASLDKLDVRKTSITSVGVKCIQKHLPELATLEVVPEIAKDQIVVSDVFHERMMPQRIIRMDRP